MKKGINMVSLSISLIVILIITAAVSVSILNVKQNADRTKFVTEISLINQEIINYKDRTGKYPEAGVVTLNLENFSEETIEQFENEKIENNELQLYLIDFAEIGIETKHFGNNKDEKNIDVYAFSKDTETVYYIKGIEYEGNKYYSLTGALLEQVNLVHLNSNEIQKEDCIFARKSSERILSSEEYTSNIVNVDVYIPKEANNINVTYSNNQGASINSVEVISDKANFLKFETICDTATNYNITVKYKLNDVNKTVVFEENKVDSEAPIINLSNMQVINLNNSKETKTYIIDFKIEDELSGIKLMKYEYGNVDTSYFSEERGKNITDGKIDVTGVNTCTVYAEDNAGNKIKQVITIN